jgi:hypothetical protein
LQESTATQLPRAIPDSGDHKQIEHARLMRSSPFAISFDEG